MHPRGSDTQTVSRPAPGRPGAPQPAPAPARPRRAPMGFLSRFAIKLVLVAAAGIAALIMLGAQRDSVVEIVSWMLVAAGSVQLIGNLARGRG